MFSSQNRTFKLNAYTIPKKIHKEFKFNHRKELSKNLADWTKEREKEI